MLGIGFFEMIVIAGIALVVIGPEKFPDFAKIAVRTIRELRGYMDEMKTELNKELKPVKKELNSLKEHNPEKYLDSLSKPVVSPATPYDRKEGETPVETKEEISTEDTGEEAGLEAADTDAVEEDANPEPEHDAWKQEEPDIEQYKVAGGDEFEDPDFKGPERLD
jgi:Tat protein translocase TatB subunit